MNECEAVSRLIETGLFTLLAVSLLWCAFYYGFKKGRDSR